MSFSLQPIRIDSSFDCSSVSRPVEGSIINYMEGKQKTREIIPTEKEILGEGGYSHVHVHACYKDLVVKKDTSHHESSLDKEFEIGLELNGHPNFVKTYAIYIKNMHQLFPPPCSTHPHKKLVLEKIDGLKVHVIEHDASQVDNIIKQLVSACVFLNSKKIIWDDIVHNSFLKEDGAMIMFDFGLWRHSSLDDKRRKELLMSEMHRYVKALKLVEGTCKEDHPYTIDWQDGTSQEVVFKY